MIWESFEKALAFYFNLCKSKRTRNLAIILIWIILFDFYFGIECWFRSRLVVLLHVTHCTWSFGVEELWFDSFSWSSASTHVSNWSSWYTNITITKIPESAFKARFVQNNCHEKLVTASLLKLPCYLLSRHFGCKIFFPYSVSFIRINFNSIF